MLVVRNSDHDGVDIGTGKEILVVLIDIYLHLLLSLLLIVLRHSLYKAVPLDVIDITSGNHSNIIHRHEAIEEIHGLLAETDEAHGDLSIGGFFRCYCRSCRGTDQTCRHHDARCSDSGSF